MPDSIVDAMENILYSGRLSSGDNVSKFEESVKNFIGADYFISVNNYNAAAEIVWQLIGLKEGDEVIASPMSCLASNQPIAIKKGKIVWADIDPLVGSLDPDSVRKRITNKTKAILHYHWGGFPGHIDEIIAIGNEFGVPIVEDAIESFGSEYKGNKIGNTGADFTLFSFQPVRLPTTIDGGGIICKNPEDYQKALLLKDYGIDRSIFRDDMGEISAACDISLPGIGAGLNEIGALIGLKSMSRLPELLLLQRHNALRNKLFLEKFEKVTILNPQESLPNYWIYTFLSDNRNEMLQQLRDMGIYASKVHLRNDLYSLFGNSNRKNQLSGVDDFEKRQLNIPSGWWLK